MRPAEPPPPARVHITGGPGAGKTTVAARIGAAIDAPVFDLDGMALGLESQMPVDQAFLALPAHVAGILELPRWVSEGAYLGWAEPLLEAADLVVWIDTPARTALYRVLARHLKAELRGDNRFPGWRRLRDFWRWCLRYYRGTNPPGLNRYGTPNTRAEAASRLRAYEHKLVRCASDYDIDALIDGGFNLGEMLAKRRW
jgi:adenylate kinase family enzyme